MLLPWIPPFRHSAVDSYRLSQKIGACQLLDTNCNAHENDIEDVAISSDNSFLVTASRDGTVKAWDLSGNHLYTLRGHESEIEAVALSTNSKQLVSASRDGTLIIWENLPDPQAIKEQLAKQNEPIDFFALKSNTDSLSNSYSGQLNSKDLIHGRILKGHQAEVYAAALSSDARFLVSASADQTLILWDLTVALNLNRLIEYGCGWTTNYLTNDEPETNSEAILPSDHRDAINKGCLQNRA